jgi:hypothetical protein
MKSTTELCSMSFILELHKANGLEYLDFNHVKSGLMIYSDKKTFFTITCKVIYGDIYIEKARQDTNFISDSDYLENPFFISYYNPKDKKQHAIQLAKRIAFEDIFDKKKDSVTIPNIYNYKTIPLEPGHQAKIVIQDAAEIQSLIKDKEKIKYEFLIEWDGTDNAIIQVEHNTGQSVDKISNYDKRQLITLSH